MTKIFWNIVTCFVKAVFLSNVYYRTSLLLKLFPNRPVPLSADIETYYVFIYVSISAGSRYVKSSTSTNKLALPA